MTEAAQPTQSSPRRRRINWRVLVVRFVLDILMIGLVLGLMPGMSSDFELSFATIALMAIIYGLLNAFVRPALDLFLSPFMVQTYGLVVVIVDVLIFGLLLFFTSGVQTDSLLVVIVGGIVLGLLRLVAAGFLGLTPPVVSAAAGVETPRTSLGILRFSPKAEERLRLLRIRQTLQTHALDALFDGDGPVPGSGAYSRLGCGNPPSRWFGSLLQSAFDFSSRISARPT